MSRSRGKDFERIDRVYDLMDDLMKRGEFGQIDAILDFADSNADMDYVLSLLTTSSWCREKLNNRDKFFKKVSQRWDIRIGNFFHFGKMKMLDGLK